MAAGSGKKPAGGKSLARGAALRDKAGMSDRPPLVPGDHLPPIVLPGEDGEGFDLMHQGIAGQHRVLLFGTPPSPAVLKEAEAALKARDAMLVVIAGTAPSRAPGQGPLRLFDQPGKFSRAFGLEGGGAAVITPRGRLGHVVRGAAEEALRDALDWVPEPSPPVPIRRGGAPVLLVPDILDPPLIAALLAHWERGEKARDRVSGGADAAAAAARLKRRADVWLDDRDLYAAFRQRIERRVVPEMARAYRFVPASFEAPRIGCYDAADAGAFGAHRDNRTPFTAHRRFAMSLNLNTGAYSGGTLRFPEFGTEEYEPAAGGAAIFGCDLLHEARPVTQGRRFAIFTFFTDAEGARQEQALIRQQQAAGRAGVSMR
ncbi:2OG-Fe(II) oxygenase [Muricoccus radiodurans]|uniref:2OG-Fe(II) oxygenase n=1 Tax=Muricoccus radiodurans TaxID=2231721 RepID=UPI003CF6AFA3